MNPTNPIGMKIKEIRKGLKMSQSDLAEKLNKTLRTVQKYESGEIEVSIAMINEIADALSVTPAEIIGYQKQEIRLDSLADVLNVINQLSNKVGLHFDIDVKRPPQAGEWSCSLRFDGNDSSAPLNQDLCLSLERYADEKERLDTYWTDADYFNHWFETELAYYADVKLKDKEVEILTTEERLKRRNELEKAKIESKKAGAESSDNKS
ncbi:MAG: helix-turn-helix transcriptional regulator [Oribacterium sp.]|nr:helix-turn-helix transcriptional regulator [Oribacterium sp.]